MAITVEFEKLEDQEWEKVLDNLAIQVLNMFGYPMLFECSEDVHKSINKYFTPTESIKPLLKTSDGEEKEWNILTFCSNAGEVDVKTNKDLPPKTLKLFGDKEWEAKVGDFKAPSLKDLQDMLRRFYGLND